MNKLNYTLDEINKRLNDNWEFIKTESVPSGGGYVNQFTISFDEPLIAVSVDFQVGRVEESADTINIGVNWPESPYVSEARSVIAQVPVYYTKYFGHIEIDLRKTDAENKTWVTSWWHGRSDGGYPLELSSSGNLMNCDIGVRGFSSYDGGLYTSLIENGRYLLTKLTEGIASITAIGGGMVPGTNLTIYGIKK